MCGGSTGMEILSCSDSYFQIHPHGIPIAQDAHSILALPEAAS